MDRGAWQAAVPGVTKSWTRLSNFHCIWNSILSGIPWFTQPLLFGVGAGVEDHQLSDLGQMTSLSWPYFIHALRCCEFSFYGVFL